VGSASLVGHKMLKRMPGTSMAMLAAKPGGERQVLEAAPMPPIGQLPTPEVKLTIQVLKTTGGLEAEAIATVLKTGLAGWREQYERKIKQGARLPRGLNVSFTLDANGRVTGTPAVEKTLPDKELQKSLVEILKGLQFAVPREAPAGVTVEIMLNK
jgi:hypothetical protein